jgi:hypothetical protein
MLALTALRRSSSALAAARSCGGVARELSSSACLGKDASFTYTPPGRNHLFVPGPTNIPERIQRVMVRLSLALPALGYPSETKSRCGARRLCSHDRCVWDTSLGPDAVVPRCWERVRVKGATSTWQLIDSTVARAELPCSHGYPYWVRSVVELRVCGSVGLSSPAWRPHAIH